MGNGFSKFWCLRSTGSVRKLAEWDERVDLETVTCQTNPGHQRAGRRITKLAVTLPTNRVEDFIWTWASECLVQLRVLGVFKQKEFSGYTTKPAEVGFKIESSSGPPKVKELVVTGWAGMAAPESGIRLVEACTDCGLLRYSGATTPCKLICESSWDGSDFFIVWPLPKFIFVTEKVAKSIRNEKFSGVALSPVGDLDLKKDFCPGRLSYWMPNTRARKLGRHLAID